MSNIPNYLIEAYKGYYENNFEHGIGGVPDLTWVREKIANDLPKEHLRVYLEWNGILGWTEQIYNVANGNWYLNTEIKS